MFKEIMIVAIGIIVGELILEGIKAILKKIGESLK